MLVPPPTWSMEADAVDAPTFFLAVQQGEMPLGVFADWLEEDGQKDAAGVRWLADRGKFPAQRDGAWIWHDTLAPFVYDRASILPYDVWQLLSSARQGSQHERWFVSLEDALTAVAWALRKANRV